MNYSIVSVQAVQKFFAVIAVLAMVFGPASQAFAVPGNGGGNGGGGSVWTNIGPCGSPQNVNHYTVGDDFYGHGTGFTANTVYTWIVKTPGNGGTTIETGTITTDGTGSFCEKLFDIDTEHIGGPYQFNVGDSKNDNFSVVAAPLTVDVSVTKTANIQTPVEGGAVAYTIVVTNNGTGPASNVVVTDVLPAGVAFASAVPAPDALSAYTWTFPSIASGATQNITLNVTVNADQGGNEIVNVVNVTTTDTDTNPGNNTDNETIEIEEPIMGCTDPDALNPTRGATVDDGSCSYMCVYSDVSTQEGGADSFVVPKHPAWATISGADWIWGDAAVVDGSTTTIQTFTKVFNVNGAPTAASLEIASDNGYKLVVNSTTIVDRLNELSTYSPSTIHNILSEIDANTQNTIEITVKNPAWQGENPAGLAYKLTTTDASCEAVDPDLGSITIVKEFAGDVEPADWTFEFEGDLGQGGFTLSDETPSRTFENRQAGEYLVNEIVPTGWSAPVVECTDGSGAGQGDDQLVVVLSEGEDVTCTFTNRELPPEPTQCLLKDGNLLTNGSFEAPTVTANGGQWENFAAVTGWTLLADGLELWNGLFGGANDGLQNAELDGNTAAATAISQTVATVVGNDYKLTYDFAARPNTNLANNVLEVVIDGAVVDTISADGTGDGSIDWGTYTFEFTAATTSTVVEFRDAGTDDGYGTLLDGTELCLTEDNSDNEPDTYRVFGQVWHDENENDERDLSEEDSEDFLEGWLITITDNDGFVATTTSDEYGDYAFEVPAGEYVITQTMQEGWALTFPNDGSWEVCVPIACEDEETLIEELLSMIVPTAHAAVAANNGPLNFGNVRTTPGYSQGSYGGGNGNGRNISLRDNDDDSDEDDGPDGQVLGEATSTMPVGAPNTGAGGAAASYVLHGLVAILATRKGVQVSNGK